jgi:hypothetical protein
LGSSGTKEGASKSTSAVPANYATSPQTGFTAMIM